MEDAGDPRFLLQWGLELSEGVVGGRPVVFVSGDVHGFNAHKLAELLLSYCRQDEVVLDASGVKRFSPAGVAALLSGKQRLDDAGCSLVLRRPSATVLAVIDSAGKRAAFEIEGIETSAEPSSPTYSG